MLASGSARADDEQALSVGLGYASFSAPGVAMGKMEPPSVSPDWGFGASGTYERAIGSDLALRADLAAGLFRGGGTKDQSVTSYAALGSVGATVRFDILRAVPYAFGGVGAVGSMGGPIDRGLTYVLAIGGGVDYLFDRERSMGLEIRLASFGGDVTVLTANVRLTRRWGFF